MKKSLAFAAFLVLFSLPSWAAVPTVRDSSLVVSEVVSGLSAPTTMAFIGANDILVLQKNNGQVRRVANGVLQSGPVLDVNVDSQSERGLLGIAVHPNFPGTPFIYLYFTESSTGTDSSGSAAANRVYQYTWNSGAGTLTHPTPILNLPVNPGPNHDGGIILFGPDGKLYVVIGDLNHDGQLQNNRAQGAAPPDDTGVILRINADGTTPSDNPFFSQGGNLARYFAYGIRNSFGMAFDPVSQALWMTENGPGSYDEINRVNPGFNSGWRTILGPDDRDPSGLGDLVVFPGSHYADPKFSWFSPVGITGLAFLNSTALGSQYQFDAFVGDINNGRLYRFKPNGARDGFTFSGASLADLVADNASELDEVVFGTGFGGIADVKVGPDGRLYVVSLGNGAIYAIGANGNHNDTTPPETAITSGPTGTITTGSATFSWSGTDNLTPTANLVYAYRLAPIESGFSPFAGATTRTYSNLANGSYEFIVKARDQAGNEDPTPATRSSTVNVNNNNPTITLTYDGRLRDRVGQAERALAADGKIDGVFSVMLSSSSGNRTVTRLQLANTPGGVWNTVSNDAFWSLGVADNLDTPLRNDGDDAVSFPLNAGGGFKIFAADFEDRMFFNGTVFTLLADFADGSSASASVTLNLPSSSPTIVLTYEGRLRDRVGQGERAFAQDGRSDGVFTVTLTAGSGNRVINRLQLTNAPGGVWNTVSNDTFWTLGVADGWDSPLLNHADDTINLPLNAGASFKIFAADFQERMFFNGTVFTLIVNFADGNSATASVTLSSASSLPASISLSYDGRTRDRVGQAEFAARGDGLSDGVFTVTLNPGSGHRTVSRLQLTNAPGGVWNTVTSDIFWILGVANGLDAPLINNGDDTVSFALSDGASFKVFAADFQDRMYLSGTVFTLAAVFADGSTATQNVVIP